MSGGASDGKGGSETRPYGLYERWGWLGALGLLILFWVTNTAVAAYLSQGKASVAPLLYTLIPLLIPPFIALLAIPSAMRGGLWLVEQAFPHAVAARLAVGNIRKQKSRALLTTTMFAVSLMLVVAFAGIAQGFTDYFAKRFARTLTADFFVAAPSTPIPADLETDLATLRAEAQVFEMTFTRLPGYDMDSGIDVILAGMDYLRTHPSLVIPIEGSLDEAERYSAAGPTLFLTEAAARRHNLHVGEVTLVDTLEGPVMFTVGLIEMGPTVIPIQYGPRYFGVYPSIFLVNALPGHDKAALAARLKALEKKHNLLLVDDPDTWVLDTVKQSFNALMSLFAGLTSISGIVASLNLVNLLVASVLERQRELGTLRALGLTQAQVRVLVVVEAGLLGLVGSLLGVVGALVISWTSVRLFAEWSKSINGPMTEAPTLPWAVAGLTLILGPGIAMLAALWPADRAASVNPADAMRAEGATGFLPPAKHLGP
ncbi:MAG: FtsX-like permease family protein, partial [Chloroflexota bacterium]